MKKQPKELIIMDGIGIPKDANRSAVTKENTKYLQHLAQTYPTGKLNSIEESVGLPMGQTGTSDVGHLTIGTGRVIYQPLVRINKAIESGEFFRNPAIMAAVDNAKKNNKALHLLGIPTDGGVHSHIDHLLALLGLCAKEKLKKVYVHFFADGRDVAQKSAIEYMGRVQSKIDECGCGEIVSLVGRFYALDRDNNWDRVEKAYNMMVNGEGAKYTDLKQAVRGSYASGITDEFMLPAVKVDKNGNPIATIGEGDSVIIYNYRADRERQLAYALSDSANLPYAKKLHLTLVCMTNYDENLGGVLVAYDNLKHKNILSEVLSARGYKQLKVAETEKYAYITFAFNAGRNEAFENEDRKLVASEKLKMYNVKPEMSAREIAEAAVEGINSGNYDCVIINFANGDMVGHSGDKEATKIAVGVVDECVEKVVEATLAVGGEAIVTADHGNADVMEYPDGSPNTSHSINLVPVFVVGKRFEGNHKVLSGTLADIAPTYLKLMGETIPTQMTGKPLI
jgi:2,3-bisphosphoglycerate-independent phosphoglycerate mutase